MKECRKCGTSGYRVESQFCLKCGDSLTLENETCQNICTNTECDWHKTKFIYPDDALFCDVCGNKTVYNK